MRKIIHIDMDAFFASVEQRDHPELRGRPIAVGGSSGRGVVAAASYEARRFGVHSAMPSAIAARKCPGLVFTQPRFDVYKSVSRQIRTIFQEYASLVEPLSLDEAFLDVTANLRGLPSATATAAQIRSRIAGETGLTASAGISYNKLLAKLASDQNKPDGQYVITPATGPAFVAQLEVGRFHGIGPKTAERMNRLGIFTGGDLRRQSRGWLQERFGKAGIWYHGISRGVDDRPVIADRPRKSSGSETTYAQDLTTEAEVEGGLRALADEVWRWCEQSKTMGRTMTVKVRYADFRQITRSRTSAAPVASRDMLCAISADLVQSIFPLTTGVRLLGIALSNFEDVGTSPQAQLAFVL